MLHFQTIHSSVASLSLELNEDNLDDFVPETPLEEFDADNDRMQIDNEYSSSGKRNDQDISSRNQIFPDYAIVEPNSNTEQENQKIKLSKRE